jgi:hypothetical protein
MLWTGSYNSELTGSLSSVVVNNGVDVSVYFNLLEARSACLDGYALVTKPQRTQRVTGKCEGSKACQPRARLNNVNNSY